MEARIPTTSRRYCAGGGVRGWGAVVILSDVDCSVTDRRCGCEAPHYYDVREPRVPRKAVA